jgi:hypothetical protein
LDLIYSALPAAARRALKELLMEKYEYQSDIVREYVAQGREEGLAAGFRLAIAEVVRARLGNLPQVYDRALQALSTSELTSLAAEVGAARDSGELEAIFARLAPEAST